MRVRGLNTLIGIFIFPFIGSAQQNYEIKIVFPESVDLKKMSVSVDNGIDNSDLFPIYKNNSAILSGRYYSRYPVLRFIYPLTKHKLSIKTFFIDGGKGEVKFVDSHSPDVLEKFTSVNAIEEYKYSGAKELKDFVHQEEKVSDEFVNKYRDEVFDNDSLLDILNELDRKVLDKQLDFIKKNGDWYYSFWFFKDRLIGNPNTFDADTLLSVFNSSFPNELQNSVEGREVRKLLEGRTIKRYALAPDFTSKTYDGKLVKLSDMKGRFVMLDFWASWCGPCIELMPEIRKVRERFPAEQVEIISVSRDKDTSAFLKNIEKHGMTWLNILTDPNVYKSYGGRFLPDVYIIDREGKIIYRGQTDDPVDYVTFLEAEMKKPVGSAKL